MAQTKKEARNPLRRWFERQPPELTGAVLGKALGISAPYVFILMDELSVRYMGMETAFALEDFTRGKVKARAMYEFARENRARLAKIKNRARLAKIKGEIAA